MCADTTTYEVRVKTKNKNSSHYSSFLGMHIKEEIIKMFHIPARTHQQARKKAEKYGQPLSVRRADTSRMERSIEQLDLKQAPSVYEMGNPYSSAIAMDEMIWNKQNKKIKNREKDKEEY